MAESVYITGHKNPDSDSICASIAYAELKKRLGVAAVPVRTGEINRETQFVLDCFGIDAPGYLGSVKTQISDLDIDIINPVSADISIKTAWSIMQKNNRKMLPIADENGKLLGIVTLSDITDSYMNAHESNSLSVSNTPLRNIRETLNAKLISRYDTEFNFSGKVVIAAMEPDSMGPFIGKDDIVLVGNREDAQRRAIELGVACIIVTCGGGIGKEVLTLADKNNCIVLETAFDTFTSARLINQSIPVGFIMTKDNIVSFHICDYIDSIRDLMLKTRYRSYPVVDDAGSIKGFISRYHLISQNRKKVILLDHNEKIQTIDGIEQAEILEIIDHHRLGGIETGYPVYVRNELVGSTSTLVAGMYFDNGIIPSKGIAGILCAAIISDTIKFKSPTSTYSDISMASKLANIAEIDINDFSAKMFKAGSAIEGMSPEEIVNNDFKEYVISKYKIGIGQINVYDLQSIKEMKSKLLAYMEQYRGANQYNLLLLMVTDIIDEGSFIIFTGNSNELLSKAFNVKPEEDSIYLKGVISRKKQVIPLLTNAIMHL
ncbi:MAG: putative manganese-dependent inorganic diphosphatase [Eubacteriales bacterium]